MRPEELTPDEKYKAEYIRRCSKAELAAMYLNDQITSDEYFEVIKEQDGAAKTEGGFCGSGAGFVQLSKSIKERVDSG